MNTFTFIALLKYVTFIKYILDEYKDNRYISYKKILCIYYI